MKSKHLSNMRVIKVSSKSLIQHDITDLICQCKNSPILLKDTPTLMRLIEGCYDNKLNQIYVCNLLGLPFCPGPVSLTGIPENFLPHSKELFNLMTYLKKVKEYYYCWIIYFDHQLSVLNVKLLKKCEFLEDQPISDLSEFMVGVFIGKKCVEKGRIMSVIDAISPAKNNTFTLSTKTTKETINSGKKMQKVKSISMKEHKYKPIQEGKEKSKQSSISTFTHKTVKKKKVMEKHEGKTEKKNDPLKALNDVIGKFRPDRNKNITNPFLKKHKHD